MCDRGVYIVPLLSKVPFFVAIALRVTRAKKKKKWGRGKKRARTRWKLAIQSFDFWIEHIPGKDNIVADGLSRFCKKDQDMVTTSLNFVYNITTLHESMQIDEEFQRASEAVLLLSKQK